MNFPRLYFAAGAPSIAIPARTLPGNAPRGITLVGDLRSEPRLLRIAAALERVERGRRAPRLTEEPIPAGP